VENHQTTKGQSQHSAPEPVFALAHIWTTGLAFPPASKHTTHTSLTHPADVTLHMQISMNTAVQVAIHILLNFLSLQTAKQAGIFKQDVPCWS